MRLPLFPLNTVLFPGMSLPLHIFEPRYREMIGLCLHTRQPFGVVLIRSGAEAGEPADPYPVGVTAAITHVEHLADGTLNIETVGQERFIIQTIHTDQCYLTGTVEKFPLADSAHPGAHQAAAALRPLLWRYLEVLSQAAETPLADSVSLPEQPAALAYLAAIIAQIPLAEKQALLATHAAPALLQQEYHLYRREISLLRAMLTRSEPALAETGFSAN